MTRTITKGTTQVQDPTAGGQSDGFELNVSLLEVSDAAALTVLTDDNCGSSCGACVTFTD
ncbi:FxLD family lantipeptide [Streptomyces solincola]|uniref:FxLD family lantipeptide n=1 Tax=Streptomyces solincola TaxID=2100817 RepID=A0A2S9Q370_9ACTN|nr:FxLD family lanthipeptide [Streptomyces solincola]PRH81092.1 FxLD family lantipeptide [Streptomyces solincola]